MTLKTFSNHNTSVIPAPPRGSRAGIWLCGQEPHPVACTHVGHDLDLLVAALVGQREHLGAAVGHGRGLAVNHQVCTVGLGGRGLCVLLRAHHVQGLQKSTVGFPSEPQSAAPGVGAERSGGDPPGVYGFNRHFDACHKERKK